MVSPQNSNTKALPAYATVFGGGDFERYCDEVTRSCDGIRVLWEEEQQDQGFLVLSDVRTQREGSR